MTAERAASASRVVLGRVSAPFGLQGWVKCVSYTDPPENLGRHESLQLERNGVLGVRRVTGWKRAGRGIALQFEGCATPEAAREMAGCELSVERAALAPAGPGEYYLHDLMGLQASTVDGVALGTVTAILELPAHPVLVLAGERERLVPCVPERVLEVDVQGGTIRLDWHPDD